MITTRYRRVRCELIAPGGWDTLDVQRLLVGYTYRGTPEHKQQRQ